MIKLNNGFLIPEIGYGTFPNKEKLTDVIPIVYQTGYKLIDTSDNYLNEEFVGQGLSKIDGQDVVVVSKFSQPLRTYDLKTCFNESKHKLGKLNIYLLHWPFNYLWKQQWKLMESLYSDGLCDAIGVCNFDLGYMKELLSFCKIKPAINQLERHPLFQQKEICDFCKKESIQIMSYSPVARMDSDLHESNILKEIASKYQKTVSQIIMRWNIDTGCIPIPASTSEKHIKENIDVFDFTLSDDEISAINDMESGKRIRFNPRTRFTNKQKVKFFIYKYGHNIIKRFKKK